MSDNKRSHGHRLKEDEKIEIIRKEKKKSYLEIGKEIGCSGSTVCRVLNKYKVKRTVEEGKHTGRKISYNDQDVLDVKNTFINFLCKDIKQCQIKYQEIYHKTFSEQIIRRMLIKGGLSYRTKSKKQFLNAKAAAKRLSFAREYIKKDDDFWKKVIFTDETIIKQFELNTKKGWFQENLPLLKESSVYQLKQGGGHKVTLWSCITYYGPGYITKLDNGLDAALYLQLLDVELFDTIRDYPSLKKNDFKLAQDNSPCHTARVVKEFLQLKKIPTLVWPPYSPDLNIIENCWSLLKRKLYEVRDTVQSSQDLFEKASKEWYAIPPELCQNLYKSIPKRLQAVIDNHGKWTKY